MLGFAPWCLFLLFLKLNWLAISSIQLGTPLRDKVVVAMWEDKDALPLGESRGAWVS
jgi:hypothetical protein